MTYDLTVLARARRLRALTALNRPRRTRPAQARIFNPIAAGLPLVA